MIVQARAPVRIDFAGAWTDVEWFAGSAGGCVLSATIDKYISGAMEITTSGSEGPRVVSGPSGKFAIDDEEGIAVSYASTLPAGAGLGTSATLNVVWVSLVRGLPVDDMGRMAIARSAYTLEQTLGIPGGSQDHFASALGGFNYFHCGKEVELERLTVGAETVQELERRLVLCYSGVSRLSGDLHRKVRERFRAGNADTVNGLYRIRDLAIEAREHLLSGDVDALATAMGETWETQKRLHPDIENDQLARLFAAAGEAGCVGGKACGAGGGGCLLLVAPEGGRDQLSASLTTAGGRVLDFQFEFQGLTVDVIE